MSNGQMDFEDQADFEGTQEWTGIETLLAGVYRMEIIEQKPFMSKGNPEKGQHPKLCVNIQFKVQEPVEKQGMPYFEIFTLAGNDLPKRYDPTQPGARRWKTMLKKANVTTVQGSLRAALAAGKGAIVMADVTVKMETYNDVTSPRNSTNAFFSVTEKAAGLKERPAAAQTAALPPGPAAISTQPQGLGQPLPAGPQTPAAYLNAPPVNPAGVPAAPAAPNTIPAVPPPVANPVPAMPPGAAPSNMVPCYACNPPQSIPQNELMEHFRTKHGAVAPV